MLQREGEPKRRFRMSLSLFVRATPEFNEKKSAKHSSCVGIARYNTIKCGVFFRIVYFMCRRNKNFATEQANCLKLLLIRGRLKTKADFLKLTIHFFPAGGLIEHLSSFTNSLRAVDRSPRNTFYFHELPTVPGKLTIVGCDQLSRSISIRSHYGMQRFAQESEKLLVRTTQEVESRIVENPIIIPIRVNSAMLPDVTSGILEAMII